MKLKNNFIKIKNKGVVLILALAICVAITGCEQPAEELTGELEIVPEQKEYIVEQIGDLVVYRVYADGFEELEVKDQILAYWLTQAAIAGRNIFIDQMHRKGLDIKKVLEGILSHPEGINQDTLNKIKHYTYRFWDSGTNYDQRTYEKFLPEFTFDELKEAAIQAQKNGADFKLQEGETLDTFLESIRMQIFDPSFEPKLKNLEARDIVAESAVNFYGPGTRQNTVERFYVDTEGKHPLNSRLIARGPFGIFPTEQVYKIDGLYGEEIKSIIYYLEKAKGYAEPDQAECVNLLIEYYQTGDPEDFDEFNIAWVRSDPEVDFINGFIEVYQDPIGMKGSWEGLVNFVNHEKTAEVKKIVDNVQYYEDNMPWPDEYKKTWKEKPVGKSVSVLVETGDAGGCCVIGINLPNSQKIRETYGSKSVSLDNIIDSLEMGNQEVYGEEIANEFVLPEDRAKDTTAISKADWLEVNFHEIIGHGSGKASKSLGEDPSFYIKDYYNTIEEARADLAALYFLPDDKTIELGLLPGKEAAWDYYRTYVMDDMLILRGYEGQNVIGEAHHQATHLIVQYLINRGAVQVIKKDGKTYYSVDNPEYMREVIGELLSKIQTLKSTGNYKEAKKLVETYGMSFDPELRDEVIARYSRIDIPGYRIIVLPELVPILDEQGNIIDVELAYGETYLEQQLRFSEIADKEIELAVVANA
jgi:dipeptidyl-peptidase-3